MNYELPKGIPEHIKDRREALNSRGYGLVSTMSSGLSELVGSGAAAQDTGPLASEGHIRYTSKPSNNMLGGGWRRTSSGRGVKFVIVHPEDPQVDSTGHVEVSFTDLKLENGKYSPKGSPDNLRVDVHSDNTAHVSGFEKGIRVSVDNSNPNSMHADLPAATRLLGEAEQAMAEFAPQTTAALQAAQAQAQAA